MNTKFLLDSCGLFLVGWLILTLSLRLDFKPCGKFQIYSIFLFFFLTGASSERTFTPSFQQLKILTDDSPRIGLAFVPALVWVWYGRRQIVS